MSFHPPFFLVALLAGQVLWAAPPQHSRPGRSTAAPLRGGTFQVPDRVSGSTPVQRATELAATARDAFPWLATASPQASAMQLARYRSFHEATLKAGVVDPVSFEALALYRVSGLDRDSLLPDRDFFSDLAKRAATGGGTPPPIQLLLAQLSSKPQGVPSKNELEKLRAWSLAKSDKSDWVADTAFLIQALDQNSDLSQYQPEMAKAAVRLEREATAKASLEVRSLVGALTQLYVDQGRPLPSATRVQLLALNAATLKALRGSLLEQSKQSDERPWNLLTEKGSISEHVAAVQKYRSKRSDFTVPNGSNELAARLRTRFSALLSKGYTTADDYSERFQMQPPIPASASSILTSTKLDPETTRKFLALSGTTADKASEHFTRLDATRQWLTQALTANPRYAPEITSALQLIDQHGHSRNSSAQVSAADQIIASEMAARRSASRRALEMESKIAQSYLSRNQMLPSRSRTALLRLDKASLDKLEDLRLGVGRYSPIQFQRLIDSVPTATSITELHADWGRFSVPTGEVPKKTAERLTRVIQAVQNNPHITREQLATLFEDYIRSREGLSLATDFKERGLALESLATLEDKNLVLNLLNKSRIQLAQGRAVAPATQAASRLTAEQEVSRLADPETMNWDQLEAERLRLIQRAAIAGTSESDKDLLTYTAKELERNQRKLAAAHYGERIDEGLRPYFGVAPFPDPGPYGFTPNPRAMKNEKAAVDSIMALDYPSLVATAMVLYTNGVTKAKRDPAQAERMKLVAQVAYNRRSQLSKEAGSEYSKFQSLQRYGDLKAPISHFNQLTPDKKIEVLAGWLAARGTAGATELATTDLDRWLAKTGTTAFSPKQSLAMPEVKGALSNPHSVDWGKLTDAQVDPLVAAADFRELSQLLYHWTQLVARNPLRKGHKAARDRIFALIARHTLDVGAKRDAAQAAATDLAERWQKAKAKEKFLRTLLADATPEARRELFNIHAHLTNSNGGESPRGEMAKQLALAIALPPHLAGAKESEPLIHRLDTEIIAQEWEHSDRGRRTPNPEQTGRILSHYVAEARQEAAEGSTSAVEREIQAHYDFRNVSQDPDTARKNFDALVRRYLTRALLDDKLPKEELFLKLFSIVLPESGADRQAALGLANELRASLLAKLAALDNTSLPVNVGSLVGRPVPADITKSDALLRDWAGLALANVLRALDTARLSADVEIVREAFRDEMLGDKAASHSAAGYRTRLRDEIKAMAAAPAENRALLLDAEAFATRNGTTGLPSTSREIIARLPAPSLSLFRKVLAADQVDVRTKRSLIHNPSARQILDVAGKLPSVGKVPAFIADLQAILPDLPASATRLPQLSGGERRVLREWAYGKLAAIVDLSVKPAKVSNAAKAAALAQLLYAIDEMGNTSDAHDRNWDLSNVRAELDSVNPVDSLTALNKEKAELQKARPRAIRELNQTEDELAKLGRGLASRSRRLFLRPDLNENHFDALSRLKERIYALPDGQGQKQAKVAFQALLQNLTADGVERLSAAWDSEDGSSFASRLLGARATRMEEAIIQSVMEGSIEPPAVGIAGLGVAPKEGKFEARPFYQALDAEGKRAYAEHYRLDPAKDLDVFESNLRFEAGARLLNGHGPVDATRLARLVPDEAMRAKVALNAPSLAATAAHLHGFIDPIMNGTPFTFTEQVLDDFEDVVGQRSVTLRADDLPGNQTDLSRVRAKGLRELEDRLVSTEDARLRSLQFEVAALSTDLTNLQGHLDSLNRSIQGYQTLVKKILSRKGNEKPAAFFEEVVKGLEERKKYVQAKIDETRTGLMIKGADFGAGGKLAVDRTTAALAAFNVQADRLLYDQREAQLRRVAQAFLESMKSKPEGSALASAYSENPKETLNSVTNGIRNYLDRRQSAEQIAESLQMPGHTRSSLAALSPAEREVVDTWVQSLNQPGEGVHLPTEEAHALINSALGRKAKARQIEDAAIARALPSFAPYVAWNGNDFDFTDAPLWKLNTPQAIAKFEAQMESFSKTAFDGKNAWAELKENLLGRFFAEGMPRMLELPHNSETAVEFIPRDAMLPDGHKTKEYEIKFHRRTGPKGLDARANQVADRIAERLNQYARDKVKQYDFAGVHAWQKDFWNSAGYLHYQEMQAKLAAMQQDIIALKEFGQIPINATHKRADLTAFELSDNFDFSILPDFKQMDEQVREELYDKAWFYGEALALVAVDSGLMMLGKPPTAAAGVLAKVFRGAKWAGRADEVIHSWRGAALMERASVQAFNRAKMGYKMGLGQNYVSWALTQHEFNTELEKWKDPKYRAAMKAKGVEIPPFLDENGDGEMDYFDPEMGHRYPIAKMRYTQLRDGTERTAALFGGAHFPQMALRRIGLPPFFAQPAGMMALNYPMGRLWFGDSHSVAALNTLDMGLYALPFDDLAAYAVKASPLANYIGSGKAITYGAYASALGVNLGTDYLMGAWQHGHGVSAGKDPDTGKWISGFQTEGMPIESAHEAGMRNLTEGMFFSGLAAKNSYTRAVNDGIRNDLARGVDEFEVAKKYDLRPETFRQDLHRAMSEGLMKEWNTWSVDKSKGLIMETGAEYAGLSVDDYRTAVQIFVRADDLPPDATLRRSVRGRWTLQEAAPTLRSIIAKRNAVSAKTTPKAGQSVPVGAAGGK